MDGQPRFSSAVVKLTAVCNLDCSYCYMFNQSDQTFRRVPPLMAPEIAEAFLGRLDEYLGESPGPFSIVLHGGEPTLWPLSSLERFVARIDELRRAHPDIRVNMQTNGLRLNGPLLRVLDDGGVRIGVSLDGPAEYNDRFRVTKGGRGSYARVMAQVEDALASGHGHIINGFLSVANPSIPADTYLDWVESLPIPRVDVLWPIEYNWSNPPWGNLAVEEYIGAPRYGTWMARLFERWVARDNPDVIIRTFYDVVLRTLGSGRHTDSMVNDELGLFVVNTDGAYEYPDYFRAHRDGGSRTRHSLESSTIAGLADDPGFSYCLRLGSHLPTECVTCPHVSMCGGGFLPGRFGEEAIPTRRSVLCFDHYHFFASVRRYLDRAGLPGWPVLTPSGRSAPAEIAS
jgi:uncharacterized protein